MINKLKKNKSLLLKDNIHQVRMMSKKKKKENN